MKKGRGLPAGLRRASLLTMGPAGSILNLERSQLKRANAGHAPKSAKVRLAGCCPSVPMPARGTANGSASGGGGGLFAQVNFLGVADWAATAMNKPSQQIR